VDLEDELKRLFQDQRLDVRVAQDADKAVVAGARRVRRNRIAAIGTAGALGAAVVVAGTLVLAGGNPTSTGVANEPPPLTITSPELSATPETSTTTKPEPSQVGTPAEPTKPGPPSRQSGAQMQLGPDGLGDLRLGMTYEQAVKTGRLEGRPAGSTCSVIQVKGMPETSTLTFSKTHGLVAIQVTGDALTTSGIGVGATEEQVREQHPDLLAPKMDEATAPAGGSTKATYRFTFTRGVVSRIGLVASNTQDCVR
jgi:hypothetical protein